MKTFRKSYFKNDTVDKEYLDAWVRRLELANKRTYEKYDLNTSLGNTRVWGVNTNVQKETLVIFPGARTTSLFWDFDRGLDYVAESCRIFLVETNGLPNHSDGLSPDIRSLDYGHWANEVFEALNIDKAWIAGASFGGLVCMKMGITNPEKVKAAFLLNPGCLQPFSLTFKNLYYNLLPIIRPSKKNVSLFLDKAVFSKPNHQLSPEAEKLIVDYEVFAIKRYKDNTQKPYFMEKQLAKTNIPCFLLLGDKDMLFPYKKSIENAEKYLQNLKDTVVFSNVGHGIETYPDSIRYMAKVILDGATV